MASDAQKENINTAANKQNKQSNIASFLTQRGTKTNDENLPPSKSLVQSKKPPNHPVST